MATIERRDRPRQRNELTQLRNTEEQLINMFANIYPEGTINWPFLLERIKIKISYKTGDYAGTTTTTYERQEALARAVSERMETFRKEAKLRPLAPPVVYAFGWFIMQTLADTAERLADNPRVTNQLKAEIGGLCDQTQRLRLGLNRYAEENLQPYGEAGLSFLQTFPFMDYETFGKQRTQIRPLFTSK